MSSKKGDILFAVDALSDVLFEHDDNIHAYTQVIEDYLWTVKWKETLIMNVVSMFTYFDVFHLQAETRYQANKHAMYNDQNSSGEIA